MRGITFQSSGRPGLAALVGAVCLATLLTGCGTQSKQYAASNKAKTYFTVPNGWHEISEKALTEFEKKSTPAGSTVPTVTWQIAYTPLKNIKISQVYSIQTFDQPVVVARVRPLSNAETQSISYNNLRDILLPLQSWVTTPSAAPAGFNLINDYEIMDQGVRGVRSIYSFDRNNVNITLDQVAMVSNDRRTLYVLLSRCNSDCYTKNRKVIDGIVTSFTVKGKK